MWYKTLTCIGVLLYVRLSSSGYSSTLVYVKDCETIEPPYAQNRSIVSYYKVHQKNGRNVFSGNVSYTNTCIHCRWAITVFQEINGTRSQILSFKNMNCKHMLISTVMKVLDIDVNTKNCHFRPGTSKFKDIDIGVYQKLVRMPWYRKGGYYDYTTVYSTPEETHDCFAMKVLVEINKS